MDRGSHCVEVIRVNMGACAPVVAAERNNRSKITVSKGIRRMLLTYMSKGGSGKDVRGEVGFVAVPAHGWLSGATMLICMHVESMLRVDRTSQVGRSSSRCVCSGARSVDRHGSTSSRYITMVNPLREA